MKTVQVVSSQVKNPEFHVFFLGVDSYELMIPVWEFGGVLTSQYLQRYVHMKDKERIRQFEAIQH